jgi:hypothetical protein
VDCHLVIFVVVVLKQKKEVLNVPVVMRVKQELVLVVLVNNAWLVNFVHQAMLRLIRVHLVILDIIKKIWGKLHVYRAFLVLTKKILDQQRVQLVAKDSTKVWPVMIPV